MNTLTMGRLSGPATSAWTNSSPWSIAACSASWQTRSFTDLESIVYRAVNCQLSPKRKSGRKPTGQRIRRPEQDGGLYEKDGVEASEGQVRVTNSRAYRVPTLVGVFPVNKARLKAVLRTPWIRASSLERTLRSA